MNGLGVVSPIFLFITSQDTDAGTCLFLQKYPQVGRIFCYLHFSLNATLPVSLAALVWPLVVIFVRVLTVTVALDLYGKPLLTG